MMKKIDQFENFEVTWKNQTDEMFHPVKISVLSTSFCYARYTTGMRKNYKN